MNHRYPPRKKGPDGQVICRGCGAPVPKDRQTWCSRKCYQALCYHCYRKWFEIDHIANLEKQ